MATHSDFVTFVTINTALNMLSLVSGLVVVGMILVGMHWRPRLMERVSLRFTLAISATDAVRALSFLLYAHNRDPGVYCTLLSYSNQSLTLMYLFLTVSIAVNLQLAFVKPAVARWEGAYWLVPVLAALVLPALPMGKGSVDCANV